MISTNISSAKSSESNTWTDYREGTRARANDPQTSTNKNSATTSNSFPLKPLISASSFPNLGGLLICSLLLGAMFGYFIASTNAHTQAVKQDCGHYSPKTGEFLWGPLQ